MEENKRTESDRATESPRLWFIIAIVILYMTISYSTAASAEGLEGYTLDQWADAIYVAEGGERAKWPYGVIYAGCSWDDVAFCRKVARNTVYRTLVRYREGRCQLNEDSFSCMARRYAPIGADNDPRGFNHHWQKNMVALLAKMAHTSI